MAYKVLVFSALEVVKRAFDIGYLFQLSAMTGWSSLPGSRTLPQPILVLMGKDDPRAPLKRTPQRDSFATLGCNLLAPRMGTHQSRQGLPRNRRRDWTKSLEVHRLGRFDDREGWDDPAVLPG